MDIKRLLTFIAVCAALVTGRGVVAADQQFSLAVKRSHTVGSSAGTLRITPLGIEYDTTNKAEARRWTYWDIKQLRIESPESIAVLTYEDQGWLKFGADRRFDFELREKKLTPEIVAFILSHTVRPVVTAVLPPLGNAPLFRLLVKHERRGDGSDGVLVMYDEALVYGTERATDTRYWRYADIFSVLPLDRDRLQILVYEGGAGELRPFTFLLKAEMPDAFTRALWSRVNPPTPFVLPGIPAVSSGRD